MMYNEIVQTCFFAPTHVGVLDLSKPLTLHYHRGEVGLGGVLDFYLLCDKGGLVLKARFKAYGNPYLIAGAEWLCQQLEGSLIEEHPQFDSVLLLQKLAIPKARYPVALQIVEGYREMVFIMKEMVKRGIE